MKGHRTALIALCILLPCAAGAATEGARVYSEAGNIFLERNGIKTQLTKTAHDIEPALSPDGSFVVFTRQGRASSGTDDDQPCDASSKADELHKINVDGTSDKVLLRGHKGEGGQQVCGFHSKQFSSDGQSLYFLSPGWTTSRALHIYDMLKLSEHFMMPANDVLVLSFCKNKYKDYLAIQDHRYFVFGGSYDWYWLYDSTGKKEIGPLGEFENSNDAVKQAHEDWCSS
jgi:hypothetical protein